MAFTYFFRDMNTFDVVKEVAMPRLVGQRSLKIWDAGCATGAEPFTLAILLKESMGDFVFRNVKIHATDLNGNFAEVIQKAEYPYEQVQRIPPDLFEKYFVESEKSDHYVLKDIIRKSVTFQEHDLTSLKPMDSGYSLVVCKNVLMHISAEQRIQVLKMFYDVLAPGGFLATEQTQKMPTEAMQWFKPLSSTGAVFEKFN